MILNYWYPFVVSYIGGTELDYGVMGAVLLPLALVVSLVLLVGALAIGLVGVAVVPRLFNRLLQPEKTYVLYGVPLLDPRHRRPAPAIRGSTTSCSATARPSSTT